MEPIVVVHLPLSQLQAVLQVINAHINDRQISTTELIDARERLVAAVEGDETLPEIPVN